MINFLFKVKFAGFFAEYFIKFYVIFVTYKSGVKRKVIIISISAIRIKCIAGSIWIVVTKKAKFVIVNIVVCVLSED